MSGLAKPTNGPAVPIDMFEMRCWARAYLVAHEMICLQEGVDVLQELAVETGLVDLLGQDAVQSIVAKAFEWRVRLC